PEQLAHVVRVAQAEVLLRRELVARQERSELRRACRAARVQQQRREVHLRQLRRRHAHAVGDGHGDARRTQHVAHGLAASEVAGKGETAEELGKSYRSCHDPYLRKDRINIPCDRIYTAIASRTTTSVK